MSDLFQTDAASTALAEEEKEGLIPTWVSLRQELNAVERQNIIQAEQWAFARRHRQLLSEPFTKKLHLHMFSDVWQWAGHFRKSPRNIGVDHWHIASELKVLLENVKYWQENQTYPIDEMAVRFHHKLVWIHPFPNGNGRWARLYANLLLHQNHQPRFSWGFAQNNDAMQIRKKYVQALQQADQGQFESLLQFVRT